MPTYSSAVTAILRLDLVLGIVESRYSSVGHLVKRIKPRLRTERMRNTGNAQFLFGGDGDSSYGSFLSTSSLGYVCIVMRLRVRLFLREQVTCPVLVSL
jgi:hypothetical protein